MICYLAASSISKIIHVTDFGISLSYAVFSSILKNAGFENPKKGKCADSKGAIFVICFHLTLYAVHPYSQNFGLIEISLPVPGL